MKNDVQEAGLWWIFRASQIRRRVLSRHRNAIIVHFHAGSPQRSIKTTDTQTARSQPNNKDGQQLPSHS
jgi:hypothetical protein